MMQQASAVQVASSHSTPALHIPDVVRGVMLLFGVGVLAKFTVLNEHLRLGPVAWIAFLGCAGIAVAAAARIISVDARPAREPSGRVARTRQVGVLQELVVAGAGGLFLLGPVGFLMITTSQEVWAGQVREPGSVSLIGLAFAAFLGLMGFAMTFWRPQFVLDAPARKVVRYAFGRSIPLRVKQLPYELAVYSDGYFITNTGVRLGDMIRGSVGKYTFELEMLRGLSPESVQARVMGWASALGATYRTPEQQAAAEML
jgi:hypothetical protein